MALKQIGRLVGLAFLVLGFSMPCAVAADDEKLPNDVPSLVKLLHDKDPQRRGNAANQLGCFHEKAAPAILDLIALLDDEKTAMPMLMAPNRVGDFARNALSQIGQPAVRSLIDALENPKETVRQRAASALAYMKTTPTDALPALRKRLHDSNRFVQIHAAHAIGRMGKNAKQALPAILDLAKKDPDEFVRKEAVAAAAMLDADGTLAIPACIQALKDKGPHVRSRAARSLGNYGAKAESAVSAMIAGLDDDASRYEAVAPDCCELRLVRNDVAEALGRMGRTAAPALPKLRMMLKSDDEENPAVLAQAILRIDPADKEALPALIALLDRDPDGSKGAEETLAVLESLGPAAAAAVPAIKTSLRCKSYGARAQAAEALVAVVGKDAVPVLVDQMKWEEAIGNEKRAREEKQPEADIEHYTDDVWVCTRIATALGRLGADAAPAVPSLCEFLAHPDLYQRDEVIESLGLIGPAAKDAVPVLIKEGLDDEDKYLRQLTAEALGRIGPAAKAAVPRLRQLADADPEEEVQRAARAAVQKIEAKGP